MNILDVLTSVPQHDKFVLFVFVVVVFCICCCLFDCFSFVFCFCFYRCYFLNVFIKYFSLFLFIGPLWVEAGTEMRKTISTSPLADNLVTAPSRTDLIGIQISD